MCIVDDSDEGSIFILFGGALLLLTLMPIFNKDYKYDTFKIKYDTVKELYTSKDDIRDATFTNNLLKINEEIRYCRKFKNNIFVGVYQIKRICDLKLLEKDK